MTKSPREHVLERLDYYYRVIDKTIIAKQNASSGLMPASTAITVSQYSSKQHVESNKRKNNFT